MSEARLSQLIGDIYDAALDAELWPRALEGVCGFVGASMANIFWQDVIGKAAKSFFEWGHDPRYTELYLGTYARMNPLFPAIYSIPVGRVFRLSDVLSFDELHETRISAASLEQPLGYGGLERRASGARVTAPFERIERFRLGSQLCQVRYIAAS